MCACTQAVGAGIGAVYVECGQPKGPKTMLAPTQTRILQINKKGTQPARMIR